MKRELFSLGIVLVLLIGFPASLFAYQAWRDNPPDMRVITLNGNSPASGGWQPDTIRVKLGERIRLRVIANDVVHGLVVPELGLQIDQIEPGQVKEVDFFASQAGRFAFACTRWCSVDHWRMRGAIEIIDPANPNPVAASSVPPLYQQLQIDLDAVHAAQYVPGQRPSAQRGGSVNVGFATYLQDAVWLRAHSPSDAFARLRADPASSSFTDTELWDVVAYTWQHTADDGAVLRGEKLFKRDCAACHGEAGKGDGPAGASLPGLAMMHIELKPGPADFTNASRMLGASDVLLQGKILRGGMGTGMPEWGSLYRERERWDVVSYIRSFVFDYGIKQ